MQSLGILRVLGEDPGADLLRRLEVAGLDRLESVADRPCSRHAASITSIARERAEATIL
jgi:hypothetical protein